MSKNKYSELHQVTNAFHCRNSGFIQALNEKGIYRNIGRWSKEELKQLEINMGSFLKNHNLYSYADLINPISKEQIDFKRKTDFLLNMSNGIKRYGQEISNKINNYFTKHLKRGFPSGKDVEKFWSLHKIYGNNWKLIGNTLRRRPVDLHHFFDLQQNLKNSKYLKGKWSPNECRNFKDIMSCTRDRNIPITWESVSNYIGSRSARQCIAHYRPATSNRATYVNKLDTFSTMQCLSQSDNVLNMVTDTDDFIEISGNDVIDLTTKQLKNINSNFVSRRTEHIKATPHKNTGSNFLNRGRPSSLVVSIIDIDSEDEDNNFTNSEPHSENDNIKGFVRENHGKIRSHVNKSYNNLPIKIDLTNGSKRKSLESTECLVKKKCYSNFSRKPIDVVITGGSNKDTDFIKQPNDRLSYANQSTDVLPDVNQSNVMSLGASQSNKDILSTLMTFSFVVFAKNKF